MLWLLNLGFAGSGTPDAAVPRVIPQPVFAITRRAEFRMLQDEVLMLIGEDVDNPDVFDHAGRQVIRDSINDAIQEFVMLTGGYTETVFLPLLENVTHYRLDFHDSSFGWVRHAWNHDTDRSLEETTLRDLEDSGYWMRTTGPVTRFFQVGLDTIGVWPRPSAGNVMLELLCVVIPDPAALDTDRVKVREEYHSALVSYATAEYWIGRGDAKTAEQYIARYYDTLESRIGKARLPDRAYLVGRSKENSAVPQGS